MPVINGENNRGETVPAAAAHQKVLLVEDTVPIRKLLTAVLERFDFQVLEAENGEDALSKVQSAKPDIVLTDLLMPVMDGRELITRMQDAPETKNIPVVVLSADYNDDLADELRELGARKLMVKTSLHREIVECLRGILAAR